MPVTPRAGRLPRYVLDLAPRRLGASTVLSQVRRAQGSATDPEALARRMVAVQPNSFGDVSATAAALLLGKADIAWAGRHARNAIPLSIPGEATSRIRNPSK